MHKIRNGPDTVTNCNNYFSGFMMKQLRTFLLSFKSPCFYLHVVRRESLNFVFPLLLENSLDIIFIAVGKWFFAISIMPLFIISFFFIRNYFL